MTATVTVKYAASKYAASSGGKATTGAAEIEATSMGLVVGYGNATVTLAQNTKENSTYDFTGDSVSITPGLTLSVTHNDWDI